MMMNIISKEKLEKASRPLFTSKLGYLVSSKKKREILAKIKYTCR